MTDAELIRRARERNSEAAESSSAAWNTLSKRYLPLVWRYAYALLDDVHGAEDVVSETMLALLRNIDQIDDEAPKISAWLRSVVRHKIADHHRRTYRVKDHLSRVAVEHERRDGPEDPSAPLTLEERKKQITAILEGLPERQRLALEWKYVEGMRVREIATRLGETEKAVEATLYRARREFRRMYEVSELEEAVAMRPVGQSGNPAGSTGSTAFSWQQTSIELPGK